MCITTARLAYDLFGIFVLDSMGCVYIFKFIKKFENEPKKNLLLFGGFCQIGDITLREKAIEIIKPVNIFIHDQRIR